VRFIGCCQSPPVSGRQFVRARTPMSLVSRTRRPRRSTGAQRGSRLDGLSPSSRMLRGCARMFVLQRFSSRSFADARNENAPGVRVRGRLLPRKIGATDLPWRGRSVRAVQAFVATARHRRARERRGAAMPLHVFLGDCDVVAHGRRSVRGKEDGRELYARKISLARPFVVLRAGKLRAIVRFAAIDAGIEPVRARRAPPTIRTYPSPARTPRARSPDARR